MQDTSQSYIPLSEQDFLVFGRENVAYVRPLQVEGRQVAAIHSADGRQLAVQANREVAIATIRQNGLEPLSLH
jgi:hypothetical protein